MGRILECTILQKPFFDIIPACEIHLGTRYVFSEVRFSTASVQDGNGRNAMLGEHENSTVLHLVDTSHLHEQA